MSKQDEKETTQEQNLAKQNLIEYAKKLMWNGSYPYIPGNPGPCAIKHYLYKDEFAVIFPEETFNLYFPHLDYSDVRFPPGYEKGLEVERVDVVENKIGRISL